MDLTNDEEKLTKDRIKNVLDPLSPKQDEIGMLFDLDD
jgi:hypothetical protein